MHGSWRMYRCVKQASWHSATVRFLRAISRNATHRATSPPRPLFLPSSLHNRVQFDLKFLQIFPYARKWPGDASLTHCGPDRYCKMLNTSRWGVEWWNGGKGGWEGDRSSDRTAGMNIYGRGGANEFMNAHAKSRGPHVIVPSISRDTPAGRSRKSMAAVLCS